MQIQLIRNSHYYLDGYCSTCGDAFTPDAVIAIAYTQAGAEVGMICDQCSQAGRNALRQRIQYNATILHRRAEALERLATEDILFPNHAERESLEAAQGDPSDDYLSGLWYESLNQMVAV